MRLVYKERVNAESFKINIPLVLRLVGQLIDLCLQGFTLLFKVLYRKSLVALVGLCLLDRRNNAIDLLLIELPCKVVRHRKLLKLLVGNDHRVIFAVGDTVHKHLAVRRRKIGGLCHKQLCRREEVNKLRSPLCDKRFRNCEHRLFDESELLQFHRSRRHFVGLTCADSVREKRIAARGNDTLYRVSLMGAKRLHGVCAVYSQMITVVFRRNNRIEHLVIKRRKLRTSFFVTPKPFLKFLLNVFDLLVCRSRRVLIDHERAIVELVLDNNTLRVQHSVKQIEEGPARSTPLLCVCSIGLQITVLEFNGEVTRFRVSRDVNRLSPFGVSSSKHIRRKIGIYAIRNPRCTGIDEDILIPNVLGHDRLEGFHVVLVVTVNRHKRLRVAKLRANVAGKVFLCRFKVAVAILEGFATVDQLSRHGRLGFARQLRNQSNVNTARLVHRNDQAVRNVLRARYGAVRRDRILREDIRLRRLFGFGVVVFKSIKRISVGISVKCALVCGRVKVAVLLHELVVDLVQLCAGLLDFAILKSLLLRRSKSTRGVTDFKHSLDALGFLCAHGFLNELAVLILIDLAVLRYVAVLFGRLACPLNGEICLFAADRSRVVHLSLDMREGLSDLICKPSLAFKRLVGERVTAIHTAVHRSRTEHHFGVRVKIAVDVCAVITVQVFVIRREEFLARISGIRRSLFENDNIGNDFGSRIALERRVRKSDRAEEIGLLHDVPSYGIFLAIHRIGRRDEHHDAAGTHLVERFCEEIVMNRARYLLRISLVRNRIVTERNVADRYVHVVIRNIRLFKALNTNVGIRIEVLGNQTGDAVKLNHSPTLYLFAHSRRHSTDKVTNTGRGLKQTAAVKAEVRKPVIHRLDYRYIGIVRVKGRASCKAVFLFG